MISVIRKSPLVCWIACAGFSAVAWGNSRVETLHVQSFLEHRLEPIARALDPHARVFVHATPKVRSTNLPMTGLLMKNLAVQDSEGALELTELRVDIYTITEKLPDDIARLMRELTQGFGVDANLQLHRLPTTLATATPEAEFGSPNFGRTVFMPGGSSGSAGWGTLATLAAILGVGWLVMNARRSRTTVASISTAANERPSSVTAPDFTPRRSLSVETNSEGLAAFPPESAIALLADCFWGERDSVAAAFWNRLPWSARQAICEREKWIPMYAGTLALVPASESFPEHDATYLAPLPVAHLSNAALTDLVHKHPGIYTRLSQLRREGLSLSIRERVQLLMQPIADGKLPNFSMVPASARRTLAHPSAIPIREERDERELIGLRDIPLELMRATPTLVWSERVSETDLRTLLRAYSARDLAAAWTAPAEILQRLAACLPDEKRLLLQSYLDRRSPSRLSREFSVLHRAIVGCLERPTSAGGENAVGSRTQRAA